jgi:hypothetical protein
MSEDNFMYFNGQEICLFEDDVERDSSSGKPKKALAPVSLSKEEAALALRKLFRKQSQVVVEQGINSDDLAKTIGIMRMKLCRDGNRVK